MKKAGKKNDSKNAKGTSKSDKTVQEKAGPKRATKTRRPDREGGVPVGATGIDLTGRKGAEESLRESEERYRLLFHRSPIGIFNFDTRLILTDCNDSFVGILRSSRDKLIGLDIKLLKDQRVLPAHLASVDGNEGFYEGPYHVTTSGADIWVSLRTAPLFGPRGEIIGGVGIVEDITARKRTEQSLHDALKHAEEEKNKSEAVISAIGAGVSILDAELKIVYQNEQHKDLVGAHVGEFCYLLYHDRQEACEGCPVILALQDGLIHTTERSGLIKGKKIDLEVIASPLRDFQGRIIAGIEVVRDISGRKQMEQDREKLVDDLRVLIDTVSRSQKEWRDTFDSIQDPIYITDAEYRIIKANKAFAQFAGMGFSEVLGKKCYELLHRAPVAHRHCPHQSFKEQGRPIDLEVASPDGKSTLVVSHFPYFGSDGAFCGFISIVRDVTAEREKEMRFIMSERLASLGQMAASIAHEINNPLAAILGCAEALQLRVKKERYDPALFDKYLAIIQEEVARCKNITTGMLSVSRKATSEKGTVDVNAVLRKALELVGYEGRMKKVEVVRSLSPELHPVHGSESELKQVFLSLLSNALDAMADNGRLTIKTGLEGGLLTITISDTGPGILSEHLHRIFDPFFTTKSDSGGTGLGLSIAKKIIMNHHGDISVSSEAGKGTVFTITLPQK